MNSIWTRSYSIVQLDQLAGVQCPCGVARRGFAVPDNNVATVHLTKIQSHATAHYHKKTTEIYIVLEGTGEIELDGRRHAVKPLTAVMIRPGCRHRAMGSMTIINVVIPPFDPADEWFD